MSSQLSEDNLEPEQLDDPESGWTWFLSLASIVLLVITVVAVTVIFYFFRDLDDPETGNPFFSGGKGPQGHRVRWG